MDGDYSAGGRQRTTPVLAAERGEAPVAALRSFNEAAHKLGYWPLEPATRPDPRDPDTSPIAAENRDVVAHAGKLVLALGALGIVYGDLGTSPLYTVQTIFQAHSDAAHTTVAGIYGVSSLIFWALTIIVSVKYAGFIMRAHNRGDGGIMALVSLVVRRRIFGGATLVVLGIFGAGLFFGDGMVTPAISVTSAVAGLDVVSPSLASLVIPISLGIMVVLFAVQSHGTASVGWLFGPIICVFFLTIGGLGLGQIVSHPSVLQAFSPVWGVRFFLAHGGKAFLTLGSVVLCVTGAETLYADRGHFGASPIRATWFLVVLPCVMCSYLGQGALILEHPRDISNPFFLLVPHSLLIPMVILSSLATIIASQAAITGSFSVARQAVQLGFLPRLKISHTSQLEGQIYVPLINWMLACGVVGLILVFRNSARLTDIYGVAVTGTFILNTILFVAVARSLWRTPRWQLAILASIFLTVEVAFFAANLAKVTHGGWLPLVVGLAFAALMLTWRKGHAIVTRNRTEEEGPLPEFLERLGDAPSSVQRVAGLAIFLNPDGATTPLALRAEVERLHVIHQRVLIVSLDQVGVPHVERAQRYHAESLGIKTFRVTHLTIKTGYRDEVNVPAGLAEARKLGLLERNLDLEHASYVISRITITPSSERDMSRWRKQLFIAMARNAASPIQQFNLPIDRTVLIGSQIRI